MRTVSYSNFFKVHMCMTMNSMKTKNHASPGYHRFIKTFRAELPTITISAESLQFSVLRYACTLKTKINLSFPVIVPYGAVFSLFSCTLYHFVACSAQPLWCSSHGSCSRLHSLKAFAAPFFPGGPWILWSDVVYLCRRSSLSYNVSWYRDSKNYGSGPGQCGFCLRASE